MKFGKRLKQQIEETLPEWREKLVCYKDLKKLVRLMSAVPTGGKDEKEFVHMLNAEIDKFNAFFVEQEENFVIRQKELQERIQDVSDRVGPNGTRPSELEYRMEMRRIRKDAVNLHGEMVLLENYSNINYTGLAKILKKYDKQTGNLLRFPFMETVLEQPFFTTDIISSLVKECENTIDIVFSETKEEAKRAEGCERQPMTASEQSIYRNTVAALATMREMRGGSSTYSHFSLPPLSISDADVLQSLLHSSNIPIQ